MDMPMWQKHKARTKPPKPNNQKNPETLNKLIRANQPLKKYSHEVYSLAESPKPSSCALLFHAELKVLGSVWSGILKFFLREWRSCVHVYLPEESVIQLTALSDRLFRSVTFNGTDMKQTDVYNLVIF